MILDRIKHYQRYDFGPYWEKAFQFLMELRPEADPGRYEIDGDNVFALVLTYDSVKKDKGLIETHKTYTDVQCTLAGSEGMYVYDGEALEVLTPYNPERDVMYYHHKYDHEHFVNVLPGEFAVFFPTDAHMPQMETGQGPMQIKKVVVKIKTELLPKI